MASKEKRRARPVAGKNIQILKKRHLPLFKLESAPSIANIKDLIDLTEAPKFYTNINTEMLWRITPHLKELNRMIGMDSLKETIFFQVIYYLQNMHTKNKNDEYLHTVIMGPPGHGKCLAKGTKVMLYSGETKNVEDITVKDILIGDDSKERKVLGTCSGFENMYEIVQTYGENYTVNESHILSLKLNTPPVLISSGGKFRVEWYDYHDFRQKEFADYFVSEKFWKSLPQKGDIINIEVREYLTRSDIWKENFRGYKVDIVGSEENIVLDPYNAMHSYLSRETKEENIRPELDVFHWKKIDRLILLAGIIDFYGIRERGDSDRSRANGEYVVKTSYSHLLKIEKLARSVGMRTEMSTGNVLRIYGNTHLIHANKAGLCSGREYDDLTYKIVVNKLGYGEYFGFSIDGNKRFLLGDFTVTHNTEVARIIGKLYSAMGILSDGGNFQIARREDFVAEYLGQTALKTKKFLNKCLGGVVFIDEVYALAPRNSDRDSFAKEAIDTLNMFLSEHKNDFCCIAAGYEDDVKNCFFAMNKGLERRFPWVHKITSYKPVELAYIFIKMIEDMQWKTIVSIPELTGLITNNISLFKYGGGDIETFLGKCKMMHSRRVFSLNVEERFILTKDDLNTTIEYIKQTGGRVEDGPPPGMYT